MRSLCFCLWLMASLLACKDDEGESLGPCIDPSKIEDTLACPSVVKPVCGCDEKTYANECVAEGSGVTHWTEGTCP